MKRTYIYPIRYKKQVNNNNYTRYDMKIIVCKCKQCKYVKNKRHKNRRKVKRMLNKKRRTNKDAYFVHYWA